MTENGTYLRLGACYNCGRRREDHIHTDNGLRCPPADARDQEITRLRRQVRLLHDATIVLRNGMGGHNHFDHTQQHGAGCQACIAQRNARLEADRLLEECRQTGEGARDGR